MLSENQDKVKGSTMSLKRNRMIGETSSSSAKSVMVALAEGETQILDMDEFAQKLKTDPHFTRNGDHSPAYFACHIMEGNGERNRAQGTTAHSQILTAMLSAGSNAEQSKDSQDEVDPPNDLTAGCGGWMSTAGETIVGALKTVFKSAGKIYKVSDLLAGAFGPTRTRQKVEKCLTEVGCLLIVYSLFLALALASHEKFSKKPAQFPTLKISTIIWYAISLSVLFGYGIWMVRAANTMASNENYRERMGRIMIAGAIFPLILSIGVLAFA